MNKQENNCDVESFTQKLEIMNTNIDNIIKKLKAVQSESELIREKETKIVKIFLNIKKYENATYISVKGEVNGKEEYNDTIFSNLVSELFLITDSKAKNFFHFKNSFKEIIENFEISEKEEVTKIKLGIKFSNERNMLKVSEELKELVNFDYITYKKLGFILYKYFQEKDLIKDETIYFDEILKKIFKREKIEYKLFSSLLEDYILPPDIFICSKDNIKTGDVINETLEYKLAVDPKKEDSQIYEKEEIGKYLYKETLIRNHIDDINTKINKLDEYANDPRKFIKNFLMKEYKNLNISDFYMRNEVFNDKEVQKIVYDLISKYK